MALSERFDAAVAMASELHRPQTRKGTSIPYVSHLLAVCGLVLEHGGTEDEAIAALLHDAVEDVGPEALEGIRGAFGDGVASLVRALSDTDQHPKPPWRERKEQYLRHLERAPRSVLLVSCADKLHNLRAVVRDYRDLGDALWDRFNASASEQVWYYRRLEDVFHRRLGGGLVADLSRALADLEWLLGSPVSMGAD